MRLNNPLIYLATPYTSVHHELRQKRFEQINYVAGALLKAGKNVYSPISHWHSIAKQMPDIHYDFFMEHSLGMLLICDELWILNIPGVSASNGVRQETQLAQANGIPIHFFTVAEIPNCPEVPLP
jgi:hypothetical protein